MACEKEVAHPEGGQRPGLLLPGPEGPVQGKPFHEARPRGLRSPASGCSGGGQPGLGLEAHDGPVHVLLHDAFRGLAHRGPDGIDDQPMVVQAILHLQGADDVLHGDFEDAAQDVVDLDDDGIAGGLGQNEVELEVGAGELGHIVPDLDHLLVNGFHLGQVLVGGAFGGQGGRTLLDDAPVFENLQDVDIVQDQQGDEGVEVDLAALQLPDKGALAVSGFQDPQGDQMLDAFPDGDPAHAHGLGQLVFGGKFAARRPGAAKNLIAELPGRPGRGHSLF